jgi:hypothetical protein
MCASAMRLVSLPSPNAESLAAPGTKPNVWRAHSTARFDVVGESLDARRAVNC